jgi:hypothetical protein
MAINKDDRRCIKGDLSQYVRDTVVAITIHRHCHLRYTFSRKTCYGDSVGVSVLSVGCRTWLVTNYAFDAYVYSKSMKRG